MQTKIKVEGMNKRFDTIAKALEELARENNDLNKVTNHSIVTSALVTKTGRVFKGINVAWWHSACAEVGALSNGFLAGERDFEYLLSLKLDKRTGKAKLIAPCGICREMFDEFNLRHLKCVLKNSKGEYEFHTIDELLPQS